MAKNVDVQSLLVTLTEAIVSTPEAVAIRQMPTAEEDVLLFTILVDKEDIGRVIGKSGRMASSIRTLAVAAGRQIDKKVKIQIEEFDE
ncbi:KH domain-containing protein [Culicoidibacter larvae]|uniref:KH domain-containing protein n=1 Tax=Culicoidibacter larvae TaxID=2579976 RepID=A0A5R8Q8R1_9FIRM|nr:KH domain-containing protein [Culicoidibacter larvae]TLG72102.1 KH domain-containing protein [Culicoidibacter larvae]